MGVERSGFIPAKTIPPGWTVEDTIAWAEFFRRELKSNGPNYPLTDQRRLEDRIRQLLAHAERQKDMPDSKPEFALIDPFPYGTIPKIDDLQLSEWLRVAKMLRQLPVLSSQVPLNSFSAIQVEVIGPENLWDGKARPPGQYPFLIGPDGDLVIPSYPLEQIDHSEFTSLARRLPTGQVVAGGRVFTDGDYSIWKISNQCATFMPNSNVLPPARAAMKFWNADVDRAILVGI